MRVLEPSWFCSALRWSRSAVLLPLEENLMRCSDCCSHSLRQHMLFDSPILAIWVLCFWTVFETKYLDKPVVACSIYTFCLNSLKSLASFLGSVSTKFLKFEGNCSSSILAWFNLTVSLIGESVSAKWLKWLWVFCWFVAVCKLLLDSLLRCLGTNKCLILWQEKVVLSWLGSSSSGVLFEFLKVIFCLL